MQIREEVENGGANVHIADIQCRPEAGLIKHLKDSYIKQNAKKAKNKKEMDNPNLKQEVCISQDHPGNPRTERYIVENIEDFNVFLRAFPRMNMRMLVDPVEKMIEDNHVVLFTDPNHLSGYNTYTTEHESGLIRESKLEELNNVG